MVTSTVTKPHQRYHLANGDRIPGVTTILDIINKPALVPWGNKLGFQGINSTERLNYLADAGTLAHALIAQRLGGDVADYAGYAPDQVCMAERALSGFYAWSEGKALEAHELERSLTSERYRYGGTLDALLVVGGRPVLVDFKTSSRIYDDHLFQLAAYHQLLTENAYTVDGAMVLRLSRDEAGEWSERVLFGPEIEPYFAVFRCALDLHNAIKLTTKRGAR